jgi:hypothetical protein
MLTVKDIIGRYISMISKEIKIDSIEEVSSGVYKVFTCNTKWAMVGYFAEVRQLDAETNEFIYTQAAIIEVKFNEYFVINSSIPIDLGIRLTPLHFRSGTILQTREEIKNEDFALDPVKRTPMIFVREVAGEQWASKYNDSVERRNLDIPEIYFLSAISRTNLTTNEAYEDAVYPMLNVVRLFEKVLYNFKAEVSRFQTIDLKYHTKFAVQTRVGNTEWVFDEGLAGVEAQLDISLLVDYLDNCKCEDVQEPSPIPISGIALRVNSEVFKEINTTPYTLRVENSQGLAVGLLDPANNLIIVPDSVAEINGIEVLTIPSGATSEIKVLQNGVEVGSLIGGDWVVPVCADGAVTITDSDGATLYVVNVTSGGAEIQAIGDSSVEVRNSLNAIVDSGVVKAQGSGVFNAPDATFSINSVAVRTAPSDGSASIQVRRNSGSVQVGSLQGQHWRVGNSTVNVRKSDGALISARTVAAEDTENYNVTDSVIENSDASYTANVKATEGLILPDINIEVNTVVEGTIPAIKDVKILITDGVNPVTPDDVSVVGDTVTVEVSAAPAPPPSGDFVVRFFDIDGTILKEQFVDAGNDATAPTNPDFDPTYLTFAEWNQPFTNVQNDIDVGAIYDTIDGKTYLFVRITDTTGLTPSIRLQKPNTTLLTVDWGDSTTSTSSASGSVTLTKAANYAAIGDYVITIDSAATYSNVRNINYMNNDATYQEIVLRIYMGHNARVDRQFGLNMRFLSRFSVNKEYTNGITDTSHTRQLIVNCANIPHINIPKPEIDMEAVVFASGARSLRTISIPNNFFSTGNMFNGTTSLESVIMLANDIDNNCFNTSAVDKVILNNSVTIIGISAFRNANRLRVLKIPNSLITLSQDALRDMDSISVLEFPDTLTTVGGNAMAGMGSMLEFVFLSTTPPTIVSTSFAGTTLRPITKIYVPDANVAAYKVATNWSAIASYIYPLSTRP